eukprot:10776998-Alexandrium_andersonii.AAC.1
MPNSASNIVLQCVGKGLGLGPASRSLKNGSGTMMMAPGQLSQRKPDKSTTRNKVATCITW